MFVEKETKKKRIRNIKISVRNKGKHPLGYTHVNRKDLRRIVTFQNRAEEGVKN